nr:9084_t:CDS:2 [Entrophospora candida]
MPISELTWEDPLASQVISGNSKLVHQLSGHLQYTFVKPPRLMVPPTLPLIVQNKCSDYVASFIEDRMIAPPRKLSHDGTWKESDSELTNVVERILDNQNDSPAFGSDFVDSLNEGTYVTNVVVPVIWATLKDLPLVNDGMFWVRKSCKPDKDEFGIIGVQVAGRKIRLSVLI